MGTILSRQRSSDWLRVFLRYIFPHLHAVDCSSQLLTLNSIQTLTVQGVARADQENAFLATGARVKPPDIDETPLDTLWDVLPACPPRMPSNLPHPGDAHVSLAFNDLLGQGTSGAVYSTSIFGHHSLQLPQLVAKVSNPGREGDLLREASFYEEMESLQGAVIPRCFGLFKFDLRNVMAQRGNSTGADYLSVDPGVVLVLLVERLGAKLPICQAFSADVEADLHQSYEDLGNLGVCHVDVRHANILAAPVGSAAGFPPLKCPRHDRYHAWRIIDFPDAAKVRRNADGHRLYYRGLLRPLLRGLEKGWIVEPGAY